MKKLIKGLVLIFLVAVLSGCSLGDVTTDIREEEVGTTKNVAEVKEVKAGVKLVLDFGDDEVATYSGISAKTAMEALDKVMEEQEIVVEKKEYDFGSIVTTIGDMKNSKEKAWMYYVNGQLADRAADKYNLEDQDQVLWRYEETKF